MKLVLGSASERRADLLKRITSDFHIIASDFQEESVIFTGNCSDYVIDISLGKAINLSKKISEASIIITCDTIVNFQNNILGKPSDEKEAFNMLSMLSGNSHFVYSGITLFNTETGRIICDFQSTQVKFSPISKKQIIEYIKTGEPMDKAGSYGIQGKGGIFVEEIIGCYYNVVGLPLNRLYYLLREMGVNL